MSDKLQQLPSTKSSVRQLRRFLIGGSTEMECDRQGRILIPSHLRDYAKLGKDALIIGSGETIEIWTRDVLDQTYHNGESIADIAESLDLPLVIN